MASNPVVGGSIPSHPAMSDFDDFAKSNTAKAIYRKAPYSKNRWQHEAVVYAEKLGFAPNKGWFKFFKTNFEKYEPKFHSILDMALNPNIRNKDKYFFFMFYNQGKERDENKPRTSNDK